MPSPNPKQRDLIESLDGINLVDAGAGTGKTFTVTQRYIALLQNRDIEPEDILLITFTRNAAAEMRERIVNESSHSVRELRDAPIQTFHSLCNAMLMDHGFDAPRHLGLDASITGSTRVLENSTIESVYFQDFIEGFIEDHPEHGEHIQVIDDPGELLDLINNLASRGIAPTREGWYRDSRSHLLGDKDEFTENFKEVNEPRNNGNKQSKLRSKLNGYGGDKLYPPTAPSKEEIRGDGKSVPRDVADMVFNEDRETLIEFLHDVYFEYLSYSLRRNYLNYGFMQLYAFALLCGDDEVRNAMKHRYVMIDEFQDTSEIQFKIALLLSSTNNICVVGDWKQSIYSFQHAEIENITHFNERLRRFAEDLNTDRERITYPLDPINEIELDTNYRSTQRILDFAEHSLITPSSKKESLNVSDIKDRIVSLISSTEKDHSRIEAIQHSDEHEAVLAKIQEIKDNPEYSVREDGELRAPRYKDIAVLTRTRDYGRELLEKADRHGIPTAYEGGIELFQMNEAKIALAWLRVLESNSDRGWAAILENEGYRLDEIKYILGKKEYPDSMLEFRDTLREQSTVTSQTRHILERYGYTDPHADAVITAIQSIHDSTTMTRGDINRYIEKAIDGGETHEVNTSTGTDSVTVQTIHSAKGLEHPIVILANMNRYKFPSSGGGGSPVVSYRDDIGIRQRRLHGDHHGYPYRYDNWKYDVLKQCKPRQNDEERRLLYVAMTRAEDHLVLAAGETPNTFIEELPVEIQKADTRIKHKPHTTPYQTTLDISIPEPLGPRGYSPHSLMDRGVLENAPAGRGTQYGLDVHEFAELYLTGEDIEPSTRDEKNLKRYLDSIHGDMKTEEHVFYPLEIDGDEVVLHGKADLIALTEDTAKVIDYKTDITDEREQEYIKQLSIYHHVVAECHPSKDVESIIYYTYKDEERQIEPLGIEELREIVRSKQQEKTIPTGE